MEKLPRVLTILLLVAGAAHAERPRPVGCFIPVGPGGMSYEGGAARDTLRWGPSAFALDAEGKFVVADAVERRLLVVDPVSCEIVRRVDLPVGVSDVLPETDGSFLVLDQAADPPRIVRVDAAGRTEATHEVGETDRDGLIGFVRDESGAARLAVRGELRGIGGDGSEAVRIRVRAAALGGPAAHSGSVEQSGRATPLTVPNGLGSVRVLQVHADGSVYFLMEEIAIRLGRLVVDQTVHRLAGGVIVASGRVPVAERAVAVTHGVAVAPDGSVFVLVPHETQVEIRRIPLVAPLQLGRILPSAEVTEIEEAARDASEVPASAPRGPLASPAPAAVSPSCLVRETVIARAMTFVTNSKFLSPANTDGKCTNRFRPHFLDPVGSPGRVYTGVAYDWGGRDTPASYNSAMDAGYLAGDIPADDPNTVEACDRGADCSGLADIALGLPTSYSTTELATAGTTISSRSTLRPGDMLVDAGHHVALFRSASGSSSVNTLESTTSNAYDRTVAATWDWSHFNGYLLVRPASICPIEAPSAWTTDASGATKMAFFVSDPMRFVGVIENRSGGTVSVPTTFVDVSPCGRSTLWSGTLSVGAGTFAYYLQATASCQGSHRLEFSIGVNGQTTMASGDFSTSKMPTPVVAARTLDGAGASKSSIASGEAMRFAADIRNIASTTLSPLVTFLDVGPCGTRTLASSTVPFSPGSFTVWLPTPASTCLGSHRFTARTTYGSELAELSTNFSVLRPPGAVVASVWIADGTGTTRESFVAGGSARFSASVANATSVVQSGTGTWKDSGPCGTATLWSGTLSLAVGTQTWILTRAAACPGSHTFTFSLSSAGYTSKAATDYAVTTTSTSTRSVPSLEQEGEGALRVEAGWHLRDASEN